MGVGVCVLQVYGCRCYWYLHRCWGCGPAELVCYLVHCLSVSIQLAWFLGWGLGMVNGRKEQRVRVTSALFRDKLSFFVEGVYVVLFVWHQEGGVHLPYLYIWCTFTLISVFMTLRSVLYFYVVPLCGDLLSYWVPVLCSVVLVFILFYCLWVAVCVLLSTRNETLCISGNKPAFCKPETKPSAPHQTSYLKTHSTKYHRQPPLYNILELLMMGIVVPETCWASNKICNKNVFLI